MPKVGGKHFSYGPEGIKAAQAESAKTGTPMVKTKQYQVGGMVKRDRGAETKGAGIERKKSKHRFV
jgi:hypothetical protein